MSLDFVARGLVQSLLTLTVATLLALVPPAATKVVIDNVLGAKPVAAPWSLVFPESVSRLELLWFLAGGVITISLAETAVRLWGRWYATRTVTRVQVAIRRRAFEHAVRLPLDRVHKLKSGGVASVLREAPCCDIEGNAITTTNWGKNRIALAMIRPLA